jgi:hypothetical protein
MEFVQAVLMVDVSIGMHETFVSERPAVSFAEPAVTQIGLHHIGRLKFICDTTSYYIFHVL